MTLAPTRRNFLKLAGLGALAPMMGGCTYRNEFLRYKLSLSLNTPDGVKTASVVNEAGWSHAYDLLFGETYPTHHQGEALFVDLGAGRKPLVALLVGACMDDGFKFCSQGRDSDQFAGNLGPILLMRRKLNPAHDDDLDSIAKWRWERAHIDLLPEDVPLLVTFTDINDPLTVQLVDPTQLEATLGSGISWNKMAIDVVNEPLSTGIEDKLPWLKELRAHDEHPDTFPGKGSTLDSQKQIWGPASGRWSLANSLNYLDFKKQM